MRPLAGLAMMAGVLLAGAVSAAPAAACGPETDCKLGERTYRIRMPEGHDGKMPVGAVFYMHGWRGSATGVINRKPLKAALDRLGLALIAPQSRGEDWSLPNAPGGQKEDEMVYFDALIDDVVEKHQIDPKRLLASGFSAGGMMVWNLACYRSSRFAGFVPIAGTFWKGPPADCDGPIPNIMHVHGTADTMVPIEGRPIADTRQGNVREAFEMMRNRGGFGSVTRSTDGALTCDRETNATQKILELCLHDGGHAAKAHYIVRAWRELQETGAID